MASSISAVTVGPYYKFTDCCTGEVFNFRGTLTGFINNSVYISFINTGGLGNGRCYTVIQLTTQDSVFWNALPIITTNDVSRQATNCDEAIAGGKCVSCEEPCGTCPEGYTQEGNECVKEETIPATYTGGLLTLTAGQNVSSYNIFGIRLYDDISSYTLPIVGSGTSNATFDVKAANGTGISIPQLANVQSTLWGCSAVPTCSTGASGGRLNIAGLWTSGYPDDTELCFEFCVEITTTKQYLVGIAGDNSVKFYIDGIPTVILNGTTSVTRPFNHWHTFPITLTAGKHTIRLCGINDNGQAAFAAEVYDISLATFQSTLLNPAVGSGNCGNVPADLTPYIIFSTLNYIGQQIPNPSQPGVWQCPDGSTPDYCTGIPQCIIQEKTAFPICPCYLLLPCAEGQLPIISNSPELTAYVNDYVAITTDTVSTPFCVYVVDYTGEEVCETAEEVTIVDTTPCPCPPQCYYISSAQGIVYVNGVDGIEELTASETFPYVKLCSNTYPLVSNTQQDYDIISLGNCVNGVCPTLCFKLTNCQNSDIVIYSNSDSLLPYLYGTNNIVKIIGREGCWIVSDLDPGEICDCPIDITVTSNYATCLDCIGVTAYKLTACDNSDIIYTNDDLEAYLGQVVRLDCGCYTIQKITIQPPNPQSVTIEDTYKTCTECTRTYWKLTDCAGEADPIITYTDISQYEGKVIKIKNCNECWEVNITDEHLNATTVTVTNDYDDCIECGIPTECKCTKLTNLNPTERTYGYYDCYNIFNQVTLQPGESTEKVCSLYWFVEPPYCKCFKLKLGEQIAYAFIKPDEFQNGKPVYSVCQPSGQTVVCATIYWTGANWVFEFPNGEIFYILFESTSEYCPLGQWDDYNQGKNNGRNNAKANAETEDAQAQPKLITLPCDLNFCNCVDIEISNGYSSTFYILYIDVNGNPVYGDINPNGDLTIQYLEKSNCWGAGNANIPNFYTLCNNNTNCPIGNWQSQFVQTTAVTTECPPDVGEFTPYDYFENFGICQNGVCPPPVFKNNRTVKPGYNTPNCNPDRYDEITCKFADAMYKLVLEKRYGITNCCPDDDEKWILLKELIDLQALKDPNYPCPDCPCACNSGKTYSTCNCGN